MGWWHWIGFLIGSDVLVLPFSWKKLGSFKGSSTLAKRGAPARHNGFVLGWALWLWSVWSPGWWKAKGEMKEKLITKLLITLPVDSGPSIHSHQLIPRTSPNFPWAWSHYREQIRGEKEKVMRKWGNYSRCLSTPYPHYSPVFHRPKLIFVLFLINQKQVYFLMEKLRLGLLTVIANPIQFLPDYGIPTPIRKLEPGGAYV